MVIIGGLLNHIKTVSLSLNGDDQQISILIGLTGIMNCFSRFLGGYLTDQFKFRYFQSLISVFITITFIITMFICSISFYGFVVCMMVQYLLVFTHFSSVTTQAMNLLNSPYNGVLIGTLGLTDTFAFLSLTIINKLILSDVKIESNFFTFFLILSIFSAITVFVILAISDKKTILPEQNKQ